MPRNSGLRAIRGYVWFCVCLSLEPPLYTTHVHYKSPLSEIASHGNEEKMNYEWAVKAIRVGGVEDIYMCSEKTLSHMPATCKICAAYCFVV